MQALWMLCAAFFFSSMAVAIKFASTGYGTAELMFYRGVVSVIFMAMVMRSRGIPLVTRVPLMHLWRNIIGVLSMGSWFYAIAHLPLPTAMTLNYMSGVWVATFVLGGAVLYGQASRQGPLLLTIVCSFAGVIMMLRPNLDHDQLFAGLVGLMSGLGAALAVLQVTALGKAGEPEARIVFYFAVGTVLAGGVAASFEGFTPFDAAPWQATAWIIPLGVLASLGQWSMTRAYSRGATLLVANLQYVGIIFSAIYSVLLFGDHIALVSWLGMALIAVSAVSATMLRARALPRVGTDDH